MKDLKHHIERALLGAFFVFLAFLAVFSPADAQNCGRAYGYQPCRTSGFSDVNGYQFADAITYVRDQGIVQGYTDGTFRPDNPVNRAEFTKILVEAVAGSSVSNPSQACFSDVAIDQWFAKYVCYAKQQGIIAGYPDGEFKAVNNVNFAEAAKFLVNMYQIPVRQLRSGELWFVPFVEALSSRNAIPGTIRGTTHLLTRGEMAELIMRLQQDLRSRPSLNGCDLVDALCSNYQPLSDISSHPHAESIAFLARRGLIDGYGDGSFHPWDPINRAEMLKILLDAKQGQDRSIAATGNCFSDVHQEWFAKYVCYAQSHDIVGGYQDGTFRPGDFVSMVEALKMALETYGVPLPAENGQWYQPYITFAHNNNLFSRFSYVPSKLITRGDMAWMIHQLLLNDELLRSFSGVRDSRSLGCGSNPPGGAPSSSVINGVRQTYITDVPSSYNKDVPIALTFGWHGRTNPNSQVRGYFKVYEASKGQTIMVYPAGTGGWNVNRDVAIFDQLLTEFSQNYCIDMDRIYVVGHSLGAWFTNSLACVRGDVIRASGSLGGGTTQTDCAGPVSAITMHNPADRLSPFADGIRARDLHLAQNACGQATVNYASPEKAHCVEYTECAPDAPVVWCPHTEDYSWGDYYPHGWPKWTGQEIWDFFASLDNN